MTHEEANTALVTRAQALAEIAKHDSGEPLEDFLATYGDKQEYKGSDVLAWLGY